MELNIKEGLNSISEIIVDKNVTADTLGSGTLEVYATPAMIALMEDASKNAVTPYLPEGFTTVGIEINARHIKATPMGMKVNCEATLYKVEGKKLYFNLIASDETGKIGEGTHVRYIVNSEDFLKKAYNNLK